MAAADVAGWSIPNQRRSVGRQLEDGIRLFLLDPHYGRTLRTGRVQTDFDEENRDANKVARELSPAALAALDRLGVSLTRSGGARGPREVWLCHTVCELGATRMDETLSTMGAYLRANPSTVLVLILESYVTDADLQQVFAETDTEQYAATLSHGEPLPTLRRADRRGPPPRGLHREDAERQDDPVAQRRVQLDPGHAAGRPAARPAAVRRATAAPRAARS